MANVMEVRKSIMRFIFFYGEAFFLDSESYMLLLYTRIHSLILGTDGYVHHSEIILSTLKDMV